MAGKKYGLGGDACSRQLPVNKSGHAGLEGMFSGPARLETRGSRGFACSLGFPPQPPLEGLSGDLGSRLEVKRRPHGPIGDREGVGVKNGAQRHDVRQVGAGSLLLYSDIDAVLEQL